LTRYSVTIAATGSFSLGAPQAAPPADDNHQPPQAPPRTALKNSRRADRHGGGNGCCADVGRGRGGSTTAHWRSDMVHLLGQAGSGTWRLTAVGPRHNAWAAQS